ncbi:MAG: helix-turn-helix transcriptional regulator [Planctomycetota bacterium]
MGSRPTRKPSPQHRPAYQQLCRQLKLWREEAGLTQRALAEELGVVYSYVAKCESGGRRMDPLEYAAWCKACGVQQTDAAKTIWRTRKKG